MLCFLVVPPLLQSPRVLYYLALFDIKSHVGRLTCKEVYRCHARSVAKTSFRRRRIFVLAAAALFFGALCGMLFLPRKQRSVVALAQGVCVCPLPGRPTSPLK